ncbi:hypothetical protein D4764_15G0013790 [Takifugu flavidus]|uniref:DNA ligase 1 n=1 Tax=Takifugu flavidus TaxID=433684 RepID=A0A5C6P365_9TELE|nr:hypothetical protein D4764_15G0013790 [Takifugu flavidus]
MQRSIASFFQPRNKDKKATEEPTKKATKSPLKVQNRVPEADSPIKKVAKRGRHVLDSDDDDVPAVKEEVTKQADKEVKREKPVCRSDTPELTGAENKISYSFLKFALTEGWGFKGRFHPPLSSYPGLFSFTWDPPHT